MIGAAGSKGTEATLSSGDVIVESTGFWICCDVVSESLIPMDCASTLPGNGRFRREIVDVDSEDDNGTDLTF